jgi:hypothetical protein
MFLVNRCGRSSFCRHALVFGALALLLAAPSSRAGQSVCCDPVAGTCTTVTFNCPPANIYAGTDTCTPTNPCALGACCDTATGACTSVSVITCRTNFLGPGSSCNPSPCIGPGICGPVNGGFESGHFAPWTQFGNTGNTNVLGSFNSISPHGGSHQAVFGAVNSAGGIQQTIPVAAGTLVTISFWLANEGGIPSSFSVDFGGSNLASQSNPPSFDWTFFTYTLQAPTNNPVLSFAFQNNPAWFHLDDVSVCLTTTACCNEITGACSIVAGATCPAGSVAAPPAAAPTCTPSPCLTGVGLTCSDCTYVNGPFDGRDGQLSHLGGASPHGAKAADDFYLCDNFVYDLKTFSATLFTTTFPGLVKPVGEIWSDCGGCPGELLFTFTNPLVVETGANIGPAFDGRPLRIVNVTFDVTRETTIANKNVVLHGGRYWLSIYGQSDNLGSSMNMFDVTYWGTAAGPIKGKPAYKVDGLSGLPYGQYSFPTGCGPNAWHSVVDDCCIGCTDLNFSFCTTPCKILVDNGAGRVQVNGDANGSTSQFAPSSGSVIETRSADDFVVPPCQDYHICYVEACVLTNCPTFDGVFELYRNDCHKPDYALNGVARTQYVATKIIPLGAAYNSVIDGKNLLGYKLEFHDLNIVLAGGSQYWISVGVRYTFSINERAYFCYNQYCDGRCPIHWNEGRVLTATTLDDDAATHGCNSPAPIVGCNGWAKTGNDFSFLIAADGLTTPGPINGGPGTGNTCRADINGDGSLNVQDVFDYLNAWFTGCP